MAYLDVLNAYKSVLGSAKPEERYSNILELYRTQLKPYEAERTEQQRRLEEAIGRYTPRVGGELTIPAMAQKTLRERDVQMAKFRAAQRGKEEELFMARPQLRAEYTMQPGEPGYVSPYRVEAVISAAEEGRRREIGTLEDIMAQRYGTRQEAIQDIIAAYQAGTERAKAEVTARQATTDYATQRLTAERGLVTSAYTQGYQEEQNRIANELAALAEEARQYEWQKTYDVTLKELAEKEAAGIFERKTEWPTTKAYTEALTAKALRPPEAPSPTQWQTEETLLKGGGASALTEYARRLGEAARRSGMTIAGVKMYDYEEDAARLRQEFALKYPTLLSEFEEYVELYRPEEEEGSIGPSELRRWLQ